MGLNETRYGNMEATKRGYKGWRLLLTKLLNCESNYKSLRPKWIWQARLTQASAKIIVPPCSLPTCLGGVSNVLIFTPTWGKDQIWPIFFRWVEKPPTSCGPQRVFYWGVHFWGGSIYCVIQFWWKVRSNNDYWNNTAPRSWTVRPWR